MPSEPSETTLEKSLEEAVRLEASRDLRGAARALDEALAASPAGGRDDGPSRFRALLMRAELAVDLGESGEARGILAEALRVPLPGGERAALEAELRRADDLEAFLTHRGCAG